jgi:DNA invertase Pin-like site-specific DNA recombinase
MPRPANRMTAIASALQDLEHAMRALVDDHAQLRKQLEGFAGRAGRLFDGRGPGRIARGGRGPDGAPRKRGRAFKFTDEQAAELRKQAEGGKSAVALAKELKVSLPTMYSTLRRAGWKGRSQGRRGRPPARVRDGASRKRGRAFKFTTDQAGEFRKQVEGGKSAVALARELKVSLPTMYNTLRRAGWSRRSRGRGRPARGARGRDGVPRKRGRAFKFTTDQAGEFRKQVEGGKSAASLAKELKVSLPTMYNTLKRAGWKGRK